MDGVAPAHLADIVGDQALEELVRVGAADLKHGAGRQ